MTDRDKYEIERFDEPMTYEEMERRMPRLQLVSVAETIAKAPPVRNPMASAPLPYPELFRIARTYLH